MNFLKKLALATSSGSFFQYSSPDSTYTNTFSLCLRYLQKPIYRLSKCGLIRKIISLLKLQFNYLDHKVIIESIRLYIKVFPLSIGHL